MPKLSACVIAKNEERNIARWLSCAKKMADEIVVVDTGSEDRTVEIVREAGIEPLSFAWINDFAAAKNYAVDHATGDWIVFLDADEYFMDRHAPMVRQAVERVDQDPRVDRLACQLVNLDVEDNYRVLGSMLTSRIFRRQPSLRYIGKIHERLCASEQGKGAVRVEGLVIYHTGYSKSALGNKALRNLRILQANYGNSVKVGVPAIYFADCYAVLRDYKKAAEYARQAMKVPKDDRLLAGEEYRVCIRCWDKMERPLRAIRELLDEAIAEYPTYTEFRFQKAELLIKQGQPLEAEKLLDEALREYENAPTGNDGKNLTDGSQQAYPAACVMMADLCNMHLREEEAEAYYEKSLRQLPYQPRILKLWLHGLIDRCTEEEIIGKLDSIYSPEGDAAFLMSVLKELPLDKAGSYYAGKIPETASLTEGIAIRPLSAFEKRLHCNDLAPLLEEARTDFPRVLDLTAWLTQEMDGFPLQEEVADLALPPRWKEALQFRRDGGEGTERAREDAERIWENPFVSLSEEECLSLTYQTIYSLSRRMKRERCEEFLEGLLCRSETLLAQKERIKVGFILYDASMWCGDELYHLFDRSERYEPTIYLCLRKDVGASKKIQEDFRHGVEQLQLRGCSVVPVTQERETPVEADVLFCLTPYHQVLPKQADFMRMTPKTLLIHIPYALSITTYEGTWKSELAELSWKQFVESEDRLAYFSAQSKGRFRHGYASGHPKMDGLAVHGDEMRFAWKMAQPDAKKIIWAPHWSIRGGVEFATFQWNWQFFYDYAKEHPETSWIVKPHPNLLVTAVSYGIFSSEKEFQEYLDAWDSLPNAKVVTGAYYHEIFATSDAMVLDSGSFVAEYQYTGKPLLFLTRDTQKTNDFGHDLMQRLYRADGKDHAEIEDFIEDVVLRGNDTMQQERQAFFREHLDYIGRNGKTASEFIFDEIDRGIS